MFFEAIRLDLMPCEISRITYSVSFWPYVYGHAVILAPCVLFLIVRKCTWSHILIVLLSPLILWIEGFWTHRNFVPGMHYSIHRP